MDEAYNQASCPWLSKNRERVIGMSYEWNNRLLDVLERTYPYDAKLMNLLTGTNLSSDEYLERLKEFKVEGCVSNVDQ